MTNQEIIEFAQNIDWEVDTDWVDPILELLESNKYAQGYMSAKCEEYGEAWSENDPDYHWEFMADLKSVLAK